MCICALTLCVCLCTCHAYLCGYQVNVFVARCGGGVGMGLWILECYVVMMNAMDLEDVRGCILPAPYLDEYGENDIGLR